jgi:hypothetical protein
MTTDHLAARVDQPAVPEFVNETTCELCQCRMFRHWNAAGTESSWLDGAGGRVGGQGGPAEIDTVYEYLNWLRENNIAEYSSFSVKVTLGAAILPWQHWHRPIPVSVRFTACQTVPQCCGQPALLQRDRWVCRQVPKATSLCPQRGPA